MSLGRKKKNTAKVIKVSAPPPITRVEFNSPTGDRYVTTTQNGQQTFQSYLNPVTKQTVEESLKGLQQLAKELNQPDPVRQEAINQRSRDFFDLQSSDINARPTLSWPKPDPAWPSASGEHTTPPLAPI